jgi:hypothetical protein
MTTSSCPTVETKYPLAQKRCPTKLRFSLAIDAMSKREARNVSQGLELESSRRDGSGCSRSIHGVAFLRGISTPSLSAQGEQRRSAFFNIRRDIGRRSKVLHGESDSAANDEQRQRVSQAISDACMRESGGDSDSRKALGKWRRIPAKQTMAARQAPTANHAVSAR